MDDLIHLIYASSANKTFDSHSISELLTVCKNNNAKLQISGMLLLTENNFFQVLEGKSKVVDGLFNKIKLDKRHDKIVEIIKEPIPHRAFKDWSMGFTEATAEELSHVEGLNDFFQQGHSFIDIDPGRAKKLLTAFTQGFWRQSLS